MIFCACSAQAEERGPAPRANKPLAATIAGFRLTNPDIRLLPVFRITPESVEPELMPGDRAASELCASPPDNRPREPGARMRARMSMTLDGGRSAFRPDFALGGIGAAVIRVTGALFDN